jgi:TatD DNase family protein
MIFFDSHAHLTDENFYENIDEIIERSKKASITKIINVCGDKKSLEKAYLLTKKYNSIYNAAATTPHDVEKEGDIFFPIVDKAASNRKIIAIGETGLDYFYQYSPKDIQKKFLKKYFELAKKYNLPVIIHCREAFVDLFAIADGIYQDKKAVLHCFTGTKKEALEVLNRGWYVSFSGIITFKNSEDLRKIVKIVPLNRILIETDSPFLAPQSKRGEKNEPANVVEIAKIIAKIKNESLEKIAKITYENASNLFSL